MCLPALARASTSASGRYIDCRLVTVAGHLLEQPLASSFWHTLTFARIQSEAEVRLHIHERTLRWGPHAGDGAPALAVLLVETELAAAVAAEVAAAVAVAVLPPVVPQLLPLPPPYQDGECRVRESSVLLPGACLLAWRWTAAGSAHDIARAVEGVSLTVAAAVA